MTSRGEREKHLRDLALDASKVAVLEPSYGDRDRFLAHALCRHTDHERFFPLNDIRTARAEDRRWDDARAICGLCPVRIQCLAWAITFGEPAGVWGGRDIEERAKIAERIAPSRQ